MEDTTELIINKLGQGLIILGLTFGGVAEWPIALDLHSGNGARPPFVRSNRIASAQLLNAQPVALTTG